MHDQLDDAMAEVRTYQAKLMATRKEVSVATVDVLSKDRTLTVTMSGAGEVKDIKFHGVDYASMPPAQLSAVLVETINAARGRLAEKTKLAFESLTGMGSVLRSSMTGGSDLDDVLGPIREMLRPPSDSAEERPDEKRTSWNEEE
ncbi:YbaB/EbfC family nucleoid-associated protein [Streptomyces sp. NPDC059629]|uniref:YbaB/EbfC family nucleoid-associated protein n=1 Tax=Streptomyces sp. NPDC059629 TaxID=3346889 RepID=UPI00367BB1F7